MDRQEDHMGKLPSSRSEGCAHHVDPVSTVAGTPEGNGELPEVPELCSRHRTRQARQKMETSLFVAAVVVEP